MTEIRQCDADLIYLCSCAVNKVAPDRERAEKMNTDELLKLAQAHSLAAVVCFALEAAGVKDKSLMTAKAKALRNAVLLDAERRRIFEEMDKRGIWHMPLKGSVLKDDYPSYGMREMTDNDVLCDPDRMGEVKEIMEGLGFTCTEYEGELHDAYFKPPSVVFEMHRRLFKSVTNASIADYFNNIFDRLIKIDDNSFVYRFTPEDFYAYMLAHEHKHYIFAGCGLRSLLDVYVFLKAHEDELDEEKLSDILNRIGLTDFEQTNRTLAMEVFKTGEISGEISADLAYFLSSGTFGNNEQYKHNRLAKKLQGSDSKEAKRRFIRDRVFLTDEALKKDYPFFYRHKVLLPALFVFRVFRGFTHTKGIADELRYVKGFKKRDENRFQR